MTSTKKTNPTFEELMAVMAREIGLTSTEDIEKYIKVALDMHNGYKFRPDFDFGTPFSPQDEAQKKADYETNLLIIDLRKKIEKSKEGKQWMKEHNYTDKYAIPVPGRQHRVFNLETTNPGYKYALERMKRPQPKEGGRSTGEISTR